MYCNMALAFYAIDSTRFLADGKLDTAINNNNNDKNIFEIDKIS